jgi:hypothetical protein
VGAALVALVTGCAVAPHSGGEPVTRQQALAARITELRYQIQENREKLGLPSPAGAAFTPSRHNDAGTAPAPSTMSGGPPKAGRCGQVCDLADAICQDSEELCKIADELGDDGSHAQCDDAQQSCHQAQQRCHTCR